MESNVINMFAAKKVKLHGMKSSKWTTKDKITQYKGLINLYTRDRKIIELDTNVSRKKLQRELKDIQKTVYNDRRELDNAIRGDKQKLRNTLAEHRELQMAFHNSQPKKVMEEIDQLNFNRRKCLDRLKYDKNVKSRKLIDLKLEKALLEDRLKYADYGQIQQEKEAQIITGKVQDATLRKEAAWSIHHIYKEILDIMKKDVLYFDVIIATVKNDGYAQSKCFLGATKLGQLATEYLDDRRQEYNTLEKIILKDMATRKTDIRILEEQVENASASIKQLLRKDSDITTCAIHLADTASVEELHKDVAEVEQTLSFLKDTTLVPSYDAIYPCLQEQKKQKRRLRYLAKKCERDRDIMLNKTNHAQLMNTIMKTTVNENITEYRNKKQELLVDVNELKQQKEYFDKIIVTKRQIAAKIRICLLQFFQLSHGVKAVNEMRKKSSTMTSTSSHHSEREREHEQQPIEVPEDDSDVIKIIPILVRKFAPLMSSYYAKRKDEKIDEAYKHFEAMMQDRMILANELETKLSRTSLLQGLYTEATQQLTREDIKKQSEEIVAANTKNDDLVPVFVLPTKRRKFNSSKKSNKH